MGYGSLKFISLYNLPYNNMKFKDILVIIAVLSVYLRINAQNIQLFSAEGEVSNSLINQVYQDRIKSNKFDVSKVKLHSILKDVSGNLWLGIYQKGVMLQHAMSNRFKYIGYKSIFKNSISSCCVMSI